MLIVKIEIDKSKENYQAIVAALAKFDIASAEWETAQADVLKPEIKSGHTDPSDLGTALSAATEFLRNRNHGR